MREAVPDQLRRLALVVGVDLAVDVDDQVEDADNANAHVDTVP